MRPNPRVLEWQHDKEGWWARTSREIGGRYVIEPRYQDGDTEVFDVYRLTRNGPGKWKSSRVGSTLDVETAKAVAQKNYERLGVASNYEQSVDGENFLTTETTRRC